VSRRSDTDYLRREQYANSNNLTARITIHERFSTNPQSLFSWLFERMELEDGMRVLEVGAGAGSLWVANRARLPVLSLTLTDVSEGMLRDARRALADVVGFDWAVADVRRLPFPDGVFDAVIANYMLYHVPDLPSAVAELRRVLGTGGSLFAATFGAANMRELHEVLGGERYADAFGLESGQAAVRAQFDEVQVERFPDALVVTELEPLLAYAASMISVSALDEATSQELARRVAQPGGFRITKDAGLITAR
jgi:SAM-dependent methyltransferase